MKIETKSFLYEAELPWQPTDPNVRRQILGYNDDIMLVKVHFEKGAVGAVHAHPHTQSTYVASGAFEFTIDGETKVVRAGDGVYMKPNAVHGCKCLEEGLLIDTFAPMREDFIK
jgi:quercetin dioxygenase-like cupin family protein